MQWIKYKIKQCTIGEEDVLVNKKVGYSEANLAIAQTEAYNGQYEIIEDGKTYDKEPLAIEFGGTGAKTADEARQKLNAASTTEVQAAQTTANNAMPKSGGTFTGTVAAHGTNRADTCLRNIKVTTSSASGTAQSTNAIVFVRK